jgi:hypothetical protein
MEKDNNTLIFTLTVEMERSQIKQRKWRGARFVFDGLIAHAIVFLLFVKVHAIYWVGTRIMVVR